MDLNDQIEECVESMVAYKGNLGDQLKPITIKKYKGDLKTICRMMNVSPVDGMETLKDADAVIHTLHNVPYRKDKLYNKESLKSKIGFMSMLMESYDHKESHKKYFDVYNDIKQELSSENKEGTSDKRVKETENELTTEDVAGVFTKYKDSEDLAGHLKYLATCCMTKIPSRRTEYGNCKIIKSADEITDRQTNYLLMNADTLQFVLQEYKTAGRYGTKYIDVPTELSQDIFESYTKFPRDYLFPKSDRQKKMLEHEAMGTDAFTKHMNRIITTKKIGVNSFRKYSKNNGVFDMGADKLAKEMGHSTSTAERSYKKIVSSI